VKPCPRSKPCPRGVAVVAVVAASIGERTSQLHGHSQDNAFSDCRT